MQLRESAFLLAAMLIHAAVPAMAWLAPTAVPWSTAHVGSAAREIEVEVRAVEPLSPPREDDERPPEGAQPPRDERERRLPMAAARRDQRAPDAATSPTGATTEPDGVPVDNPPTPMPTPADEYGGAPAGPERSGVAGLDGVPVWQMPGVLPDRAPSRPAPTAPPPPRATPADKATELLRESMRDRDKSIGLDLPAAGTVASAVADAVRAASTPDTARATFEVVLSGAGEVTSVRALSSTAGAADLWAQVARAAASRLAGRGLAMPSAFAKGARVFVTVSSAMKMPSGASSSVQRRGLGIDFDVADLGAHAKRVVSSSFRVVAID